MNQTTIDKIAEMIKKEIIYVQNKKIDKDLKKFLIHQTKVITHELADIFEEEDKKLIELLKQKDRITRIVLNSAPIPFNRKQFLKECEVEE